MARNREGTRKRGLSGVQGHGIGRRSGQLGRHSPLTRPWRVVVQKDCGAASDPGPQRTLPGPGRGSVAVGALWSLASGPADTPEQLSHVYDGIFLLLRQSASSTA